MRSALALVFVLGASSPIASGCTGGTLAPVAPITTVMLDGGAGSSTPIGLSSDAPDAAPASGDAGPDFFSCAADADCIAVPKNACCNNGFMEAVNSKSADAYKASFTCDNRGRMCPQFRIRDTRLPHCNADAHRCELLKADGPALP